MSEKTLDTLVPDIYSLLEEGKDFDVKRVRVLARDLSIAIAKKLTPRKREVRPEKIVPSNLGKPDREIWMNHNHPLTEKKEWSQTQLLNFLYGDIWEEILLWLAEEAGHKVEGKQKRVTLEGVGGYQDAEIDGIVVDVKTALAFNKFAKGDLFKPEGDPYGYIGQISHYAQAKSGKSWENHEESGAFLATDKTGRLALLEVDAWDQIDARGRIKYLRKMIKMDEPPEEKCYKPVPAGKSGSMELNRNCGFCRHRKTCWPDTRAFQYKNAVRHFVKVSETKPPTVPEISDET